MTRRRSGNEKRTNWYDSEFNGETAETNLNFEGFEKERETKTAQVENIESVTELILAATGLELERVFLSGVASDRVKLIVCLVWRLIAGLNRIYLSHQPVPRMIRSSSSRLTQQNLGFSSGEDDDDENDALANMAFQVDLTPEKKQEQRKQKHQRKSQRNSRRPNRKTEDSDGDDSLDEIDATEGERVTGRRKNKVLEKGWGQVEEKENTDDLNNTNKSSSSSSASSSRSRHTTKKKEKEKSSNDADQESKSPDSPISNKNKTNERSSTPAKESRRSRRRNRSRSRSRRRLEKSNDSESSPPLLSRSFRRAQRKKTSSDQDGATDKRKGSDDEDENDGDDGRARRRARSRSRRRRGSTRRGPFSHKILVCVFCLCCIISSLT